MTTGTDADGQHVRATGGHARATGGHALESRDPRTGAVLAEYPVHDADQVTAAVAAAREAAHWWGGLDHIERRRWLRAWRAALARDIDGLASVITAETGKPRDDARLEVVLVIDHLDWALRNAERVLGRRSVRAGLLMVNEAATLEYQPLGVVGVIGPWNYPAFTPMGSIAYALAAGNTVVFKPSELTPGVGVRLAETLAAAVPEHRLIQVVTGFGETGAALCRAGVDKVSFTGSTATAKKVMAACAETLTPVLAECGGKDALLVDADADLDAAAAAAVWGGFSNAGQTCVGVERVYVVDAVADDLLARIVRRAEQVHAGDGGQIGPITMPEQLGIIRHHIADAIERGGRAVVGGVDSVGTEYVEPVVLVDVPEDAPAVTDETFGPTITVNRVADLQEAVRRVNAGRYGLGAAVFSRRHGEAAAARLRCGMVSVNGVISFAAVPALPFGGVGDSGFGRIHGDDGLREFSRAKAVTRRRFRSPLPMLTFDRPRGGVSLLSRVVRLLHG